MTESALFSIFTVSAGRTCAAEVVVFAVDKAATLPVTVTITRPTAPASTHVFRFTGRATRSRSSAETSHGRLLRLAGVHCRLQLRRVRRDACIVDLAARERRIGQVRHAVGADALGPVQPRLLLSGSQLLASGVPRRWQGLACLQGPLERSRIRINAHGPVAVASAGGLHRVGEIRDAVAAYALGVGDSVGERRRSGRS